jgi:hypothetical protein
LDRSRENTLELGIRPRSRFYVRVGVNDLLTGHRKLPIDIRAFSASLAVFYQLQHVVGLER